MDLRYVLLNVHSRLSPGLLCIHRAGTAAPARAKNSPLRKARPAGSVIICIPRAGLWTPSTHAPHPDTWEEEEEEEKELGRNGEGDGGGRRIEQQCD